MKQHLQMRQQDKIIKIDTLVSGASRSNTVDWADAVIESYRIINNGFVYKYVITESGDTIIYCDEEFESPIFAKMIDEEFYDKIDAVLEQRDSLLKPMSPSGNINKASEFVTSVPARPDYERSASDYMSITCDSGLQIIGLFVMVLFIVSSSFDDFSHFCKDIAAAYRGKGIHS